MRDGGSMRLSAAFSRGLIVLGVAVASFVLGYFGLSQYLSHYPGHVFGTSRPDIIYYDLQLFVLGSAPLDNAERLPVILQVARFLAPATTVLAGVEALRLLLSEQLRCWAAALASRHAIVTGDGPAAVEIARRLRAGYRRVVLLSAAPAVLAQARHLGLLEVLGDPAEASTLRAAGAGRAAVVFACMRDSTANAATVLRAREISQARGRSLLAYARVGDPDVAAALRARRVGAATGGEGAFRLDFFSVEQIAARLLLDRYPLTAAAAAPARHILIIGFGQLGRAVLREIARRQLPGGGLAEVTVQGVPAEVVSEYLARFPAVGRRCTVTATDQLDFRALAAPAMAFVCLPDNDQSLVTGLTVAHSLVRSADRVVVCMGEPSPFGTVLTGANPLLDDVGGRLVIFDVTGEACVPDLIRNDVLDQLARAIHRAYVATRSQRADAPPAASMVSWEELPDDLRRANLAQAADIGTKLDAINSMIIPESVPPSDFAFTPDEIERLAQLEHQRWIGDRRSAGYQHGPVREGRYHPDLVDWAYLSETAREKDRDVVLQIPVILAQAGFQIVRFR